MPGRRLRDAERHLLEFWKNPPAALERPLLRSIQIDGGTGLRGINGLVVYFRYPITAVCGANGVGKSTVLALAALAFHSPSGWYVYVGNTSPYRAGGDRTTYRFPDFFVCSRDEDGPRGVSITWRYFHNGEERSVVFTKTARWGHYAGRPEREVDFLPMGRILPAYEMSGVRSTFLGRDPRNGIASSPLGPAYLGYLSYILGRTYSQAETRQCGRYTFQHCDAGVPCTAFNMGSGETGAIALLHSLQRLPAGGLLVIEEVEAGLHPQAQMRLAEVLVEVSLRKRLQIICSTHSGVFLDALPREARQLMRCQGGAHSVIETPSTRFAMYEMTGIVQPELVIYCEDRVAETLIEEALPHDLRRRVKISEIGSDCAVIRQGVAHIRSSSAMRALCVLDGDCSPPDVEGWIRSEVGARADIRLDYIILPGEGQTPETWTIEQLQYDVYRQKLADLLGCDASEAWTHIEAMRVELDRHDIAYTLHQRTGLDEADCLRRILGAFASQHPQLDQLRRRVEELLG